MTSGFCHKHVPPRQFSAELSRRKLGLLGAVCIRALTSKRALASTPGRVPGFSPRPDGTQTYLRPRDKSGGHGTGWSEITPYQFVTYEGWEEKPVSIADPEGTEIDAKFSSEQDGEIKIILAPILRFVDFPAESNPRIQDFLTLSSFIQGFGPELVGTPVQEEDVVKSYEDEREGLTFYNYELKNHWLISATVYQRRVYIIVLHSSALQWRRSYAKLLKTAASFSIPPSKP